GGDRATHQGIFDLAYLRTVPNMSVAMPRDAEQIRGMLTAAHRIGGPNALRWPPRRMPVPENQPASGWRDAAWGAWEVLKEPGSRDGAVWVVGLGPTVAYALRAAEGRPKVGVVDGRFVKPLDAKLLLDLAEGASAIITAEDHTVLGGMGSAVLEALSEGGRSVPVVRLGVHDTTVPHGDPAAQHEELGYGPTAIGRTLDELGAESAGSGRAAETLEVTR